MIDKESLSRLRREYLETGLNETDVKKNPFEQFSLWFNEALELNLLDANAMVLATADKEHRPSARIVLLKGYDEKGFVFYTNYTSRKGNNLEENPNAALLFYWEELSRQVRIEGKAEKISKAESEAYFKTRPYESRLAAWASTQSCEISSREELESKYEKLKEEYKDKEIPLPEFWGGYIVKPEAVEFWQGRPNRLHDRIRFRKENNEWKMERLCP